MANASKKPKRQPLDPNLSGADMVARSLEAHDTPAPVKSFKDELSAYMSKLGKKGGQVSGAQRKANLSPDQRRSIASIAARARWAKRKVVKKR